MNTMFFPSAPAAFAEDAVLEPAAGAAPELEDAAPLLAPPQPISVRTVVQTISALTTFLFITFPPFCFYSVD